MSDARASGAAPAIPGFGAPASDKPLASLWSWALVFAATMGLLVIRHILFWPTYHTGALWFTDDFFYYQVIGQNLVEHGLSTFDGQAPTNGYHPLWMAVVAVIDRLFGPNLLAVTLVEKAIVAAGLIVFLRLFRTSRLTVLALAAFVYFWCVRRAAMQGMETALLFLLWPLLLDQLMDKRRRRAWATALLGVLAIGARLDAVVFVVPLLMVTLEGRRLWIALGSVAAVGAIYLVANQLLFGVPMPVSGGVKSLGGPQINLPFIQQALADPQPGGLLRGDSVSMLLIMAVSPLMAWLAPKGSIERRLVIAFAVGSALYLGKLFFFSSWVIWTWYLYPAFFGLAAYALVARLHLDRVLEWKWGQASLAAAAILGLALGAVLVWRDFRPSGSLFILANRSAAAAFAPITHGARIAMGDRSGSFAYFYPGGVTQLEGLVNDKEYFEALKQGADIKPILCRRGVQYVVDYGEPLVGDVAQVETIRPQLSSFPAPTLAFHRSDLAASYDGGQDGFDYNPDAIVYLWRLRCDGAG